MTVQQFARHWLERQGMLNTESDYDKQVGQDVLAMINFIEAQHHDYSSLMLLFAMLTAIYKAYDDKDNAIWRDYWTSDEGKRVLADSTKQGTQEG